ncbi:MAG: hypothetical protein FWF97_00325 [Alphaproteobacteria bacterium]|nr:hypothetical protein [Alphaproteobacteria bacterium]
MNRLFFAFTIAACLSTAAFADDMTDTQQQSYLAQLRAEKAGLETQNKDLAEEIRKCIRTKGWGTAGVVVGAAGTVGSAIAIGVQAKDIKDKKENLQQINNQLK